MVKTLEGNLTPTNITTGRGFHFFALLELQLKGESFKTAVEQYFFQMGTKSEDFLNTFVHQIVQNLRCCSITFLFIEC